MLKGFNLTIGNDDLPNSNFDAIFDKQKNKIKQSLNSFYADDGSINGEALRTEWFPSLSDMHVFISHSHRDLEIAKKLAGWLHNNFELNSFIDSHVWGYADDLLKQIDDKHAISSSGETYDYKIRNCTTSHVHMMLSSALNHMIDKCECLIFINTDQSISQMNNHTALTTSPWIMSELSTSKIIEKRPCIERDRMMVESRGIRKIASDSSALIIKHKVELDHLTRLNRQQLFNWLGNNNGDKGYESLTHLYNIFEKETFINPGKARGYY